MAKSKSASAAKTTNPILVAVLLEVPANAMPDYSAVPGFKAIATLTQPFSGTKNKGVGMRDPRVSMDIADRKASGALIAPAVTFQIPQDGGTLEYIGDAWFNVSVAAIDSSAKGTRANFDVARDAIKATASKKAKSEPTESAATLKGWTLRK